MKAVITVVGVDKVGIIAKVSNLLAERNVNILDTNVKISYNTDDMTTKAPRRSGALYQIPFGEPIPS